MELTQMETPEQWQILAKEAAEENDPEKMMEIIEALTRALDEQETLGQPGPSNTRGAA